MSLRLLNESVGDLPDYDEPPPYFDENEPEETLRVVHYGHIAQFPAISTPLLSARWVHISQIGQRSGNNKWGSTARYDIHGPTGEPLGYILKKGVMLKGFPAEEASRKRSVFIDFFDHKQRLVTRVLGMGVNIYVYLPGEDRTGQRVFQEVGRFENWGDYHSYRLQQLVEHRQEARNYQEKKTYEDLGVVSYDEIGTLKFPIYSQDLRGNINRWGPHVAVVRSQARGAVPGYTVESDRMSFEQRALVFGFLLLVDHRIPSNSNDRQCYDRPTVDLKESNVSNGYKLPMSVMHEDSIQNFPRVGTGELFEYSCLKCPIFTDKRIKITRCTIPTSGNNQPRTILPFVFRKNSPAPATLTAQYRIHNSKGTLRGLVEERTQKILGETGVCTDVFDLDHHIILRVYIRRSLAWVYVPALNSMGKRVFHLIGTCANWDTNYELRVGGSYLGSVNSSDLTLKSYAIRPTREVLGDRIDSEIDVAQFRIHVKENHDFCEMITSGMSFRQRGVVLGFLFLQDNNRLRKTK